MTRPRLVPALLVLSCLSLAGVLMWAAPAQAQFEGIHSYDVTIVIQRDGSIHVVERIAYDFGDFPHHGIFRDIPVRAVYDQRYWRVFPLHVDSVVGSPGTPDGYKTSHSGNDLDIKIGDPKRTITGLHIYTITYTVKGTLNGFSDHDELYWNAIGPEWGVIIDRANVTVQAPARITGVLCFKGPFGSQEPCQSSQSNGTQATFAETRLFPENGVTIVVGLPKGAVPEPHPILKERWAIQRAFSVTPLTGGLALGLLALLLAGLGRLLWRYGRDRRAFGSPVDVAYAGSPDGSSAGDQGGEPVPLFEHAIYPVEYAPPDDIRPGQAGTLVNLRADPLDVTATIVDLAVRGYLRIEEIPKKRRFAKPDWRLVQLKEPDGGLLPYESLLLTSLFQDPDSLGDVDLEGDGEQVAASGVAVQTKSIATVKLSSLREEFVERLNAVEDALYDDAAARKWFPARPDKVRTLWRVRAWLLFLVGLTAMILVAIWTHLGLVAAAIPLAGLFFMATAHLMPRRSPAGTGMVRRVYGFRTYIATAEKQEAQFQEKEDIFSQYLPFAIVFGCVEKWAHAFAHLADVSSTSSWYVGAQPFTVSAFTSSMEHFSSFTSGTITSVAHTSSSGSSGFGGGGFSGGGGGGGGGGSW